MLSSLTVFYPGPMREPQLQAGWSIERPGDL